MRIGKCHAGSVSHSPRHGDCASRLGKGGPGKSGGACEAGAPLPRCEQRVSRCSGCTEESVAYYRQIHLHRASLRYNSTLLLTWRQKTRRTRREWGHRRRREGWNRNRGFTVSKAKPEVGRSYAFHLFLFSLSLSCAPHLFLNIRTTLPCLCVRKGMDKATTTPPPHKKSIYKQGWREKVNKTKGKREVERG